MRCARGALGGLCIISIALALVSCEREQRQFRATPPAERAGAIRMSELQPGSVVSPSVDKNPYEENAYAIAEGGRLLSGSTVPAAISMAGAASDRH
jgi:hypothetical protein